MALPRWVVFPFCGVLLGLLGYLQTFVAQFGPSEAGAIPAPGSIFGDFTLLATYLGCLGTLFGGKYFPALWSIFGC